MYNEYLQKGIITKAMLGDCLYSVNKRAKNARDKLREYRNKMRRYGRYAYDKYGNEDRCEERMENYYAQKDYMLKIIQPDCIHVERQENKKRFYDYDVSFESFSDDTVIYSGSFFDKGRKRGVRFIDVLVEEDKYYLS